MQANATSEAASNVGFAQLGSVTPLNTLLKAY
jgi:hypothetical protein